MGIELPYFYFPSLRGLAMYFGLIADPDAEYADYEDEQTR
jgi:hypothetical protein